MITLSKQDWDGWDGRHKTDFINKLSGVKPAFILSTKSVDDLSNFAIFSNIIHVGANPPLIGILFRPDSVARHSLENIRATRKAGLNLVTEEIYNESHRTSARYPREMNEANAVGLEVKDRNGLPFIRKSPLHLALKLQSETRLINETVLQTMSIETVHLDPLLIGNDHLFDLSLVRAVSVGGLDTYYGLELLGRLPYAKP